MEWENNKRIRSNIGWFWSVVILFLASLVIFGTLGIIVGITTNHIILAVMIALGFGLGFGLLAYGIVILFQTKHLSQ